MANLVYVALLVASVLFANVNGYTGHGPCPTNPNGVHYQPGDSWEEGCLTCSCWNGGFGCDMKFPTCEYPEGCVKVYDDNGCELMAVDQANEVCDPIICMIAGK
ncbi:PREDICTED: uncharacterized protein LOC109482647 [Branchiostoma belcheri]|uniref:Uncharacterized protein LOC109482647 n=1 Tax=Branchiostoma belcheri TaxID=7741 RepID=A0A6P4ZVT2_BRABE|nr:PREDICTED: uncharacterized protein LOC109482647 [Branchiostoma belcheri]